MKKLLSLFLAALMLLTFAGCAEEEKLPAPIGSQVWENAPSLTWGQLESPGLEITQWNSGRCEYTSFNSWAETETGYYVSTGSHLLYADKSDLNNWVAVCNRPDCQHSGYDCNAYIQYWEFVVSNGRIYYQVMTGSAPELYNGDAQFFLASMAPDGTDKRFEYAYEENTPATATRYMSYLCDSFYMYNIVGMDNEGVETAFSVTVKPNGETVVVSKENFENPSRLGATMMSGRRYPLYGDRLLFSGILCRSDKEFLRVADGFETAVNTGGRPVTYAYVSGNILRFFRPNDGYYDLNMETGEEIKLAEAQLKNSFACIALPNCILETTLMAYSAGNTAEYYEEGMTHEMRLFDGSGWKTVKLPAELAAAGGKIQMRVQAVCSDRIILSVVDLAVSSHTVSYYTIDLRAENPELVFLTQRK